jgi:hypothetical protein
LTNNLLCEILFFIFEQGESYFPQEARVQARIPGLSCKRCDNSESTAAATFGARGLETKSIGNGRNGLFSSQIRTRSGARSPRVTALSWREKL